VRGQIILEYWEEDRLEEKIDLKGREEEGKAGKNINKYM